MQIPRVFVALSPNSHSYSTLVFLYSTCHIDRVRIVSRAARIINKSFLTYYFPFNYYLHHNCIIILIISFPLIFSCCEASSCKGTCSKYKSTHLSIYLFALSATSSTHSLLRNLANSLLPLTARTAVQRSVEMSFATGTGLLRSQPFVTVSSAWRSAFVT